MRKQGMLVFALLMAFPVLASPQPPITESMGSYYHTPEQKAMEAYARGMKLKRKAEGENEPAKQAKLYLKAKEELSKSVGYQGHYDGYLALGQVYMALGQQESAFDACSHAQALKPNDETARSCVETAKNAIQQASAANKGDGGQ
jgi:cytochrome c-type biogenesis protein CcmH/NrfG